MDHPVWWSTIDSLNIGSAFRMELEQLARKPASDHDAAAGTLAFPRGQWCRAESPPPPPILPAPRDQVRRAGRAHRHAH